MLTPICDRHNHFPFGVNRLKSVIPEAVRHAVLNACWRVIRARAELRSGLEVKIHDVASWRGYGEVFARGMYDAAIDHVVSMAPTQPLVLDLGANVGHFALRFADRWICARGPVAPFVVICVEGSPRALKILRCVPRQVPLHGRVVISEHVVGARRAGVTHIGVHPDHLANTISETTTKGAAVTYVDVEQLVRDVVETSQHAAAPRIALMKVDIEGAEEGFLREYGDLLARTDAVAVELHTDRCNATACIAMLQAAGLRRDPRLTVLDPASTNPVEFFFRAANGHEQDDRGRSPLRRQGTIA